MHDSWRACLPARGQAARPGTGRGGHRAGAALTRLTSPVDISPAASRPAGRRLTRRPSRARLPLVATALVTAAAGLRHRPRRTSSVAAPTPDAASRPRGDGSACGRITVGSAGIVWPYRWATARRRPVSPAPPPPGPSRSAADASAPRRSQPALAQAGSRTVDGSSSPPATPLAEPTQNLVTPSPSPARTSVAPSPAKNIVAPSPAKNMVTPSPTKAATPRAEPERGCVRRVGRTCPGVGLGRLPGQRHRDHDPA